VQRWRSIEAEYPPKIRNAQHDTFVQPRHPEFRAVFEGFCLELMRLDASETKALAKASRASGTTVTGAIVAAAHLAVLKERIPQSAIAEHRLSASASKSRDRNFKQDV